MPWTRLLESTERQSAARLEDWYASLLAACPEAAPFELAVQGGCRAATPGLAFLAGYQAALRMLWPSAPHSLGALCVTEQRSVRPADLQCRVADLQVSGRKDFVTAAEAADWLLVAAREEAAGESPQIALLVVRNGDPGVQVEALPPLKLMPDIGHARLLLSEAPCERLAGDGWSDYVKPFRTLEDVLVLAAFTAWLYGVGRDCGWPLNLRLRLLAVLAGAAEVTRQPASSAATHLLLAGLFEQWQQLSGELDQAFAEGPAEWRELWQRDRSLLGVAGAARAKRLSNALATLAVAGGQ